MSSDDDLTELKDCGRIELFSFSKIVQKPRKQITKKTKKNQNNQWWSKIWELFGNNYNNNNKQVMEEQTEEKISLLTWHPYRNLFSFVSKNTVHSYYFEKEDEKYEKYHSLSHEFQRGITCIEWKPLSSNTLAVACKNCVLIWTDQWLSNYYFSNDIEEITSIQWSPNSPLLAIGSSNTGITIWDTITSLPIRLHSTRPFSSNLLRWSPNGHYLFQSSSEGLAFIWETLTWTREKWTFSDDSKLQMNNKEKACWSPDSLYLLVAQNNKFNLISVKNEPPVIGGNVVSQVPFPSNINNNNFCQVIDMYWNSMGHIMIQFNDQQYSIATLTQDLQLNIQQVDDLKKENIEFCTLRPNSNTLLFLDEIYAEERGDDPKHNGKFYKAKRLAFQSSY